MTPNTTTRKKILVPMFYRAHLGRLRSVLTAIREHPKLELQIMAALPAGYGSFFMNMRHSEPSSWRNAFPWYIKMRMVGLSRLWMRSHAIRKDPLIRKIIDDGFPVQSVIPLFFDGGTPRTMSKSVGLGMMRMVDELERLKPDIVLVNADRFEMMAVTLAAAYCNIPIAHNEAGDISGTIDESVRHAITKFAHLHLTATDASRRRVIQMGENPQFVFTVGSPGIDSLNNSDTGFVSDLLPGIDHKKPYLLVMMHPVTTESDIQNTRMIQNVIVALDQLQMPTVLVWGNNDANSHAVGPYVARWIEKGKPSYLYSVKWMHPDKYARVLANAACAVGNSSSFIREGSYFGTPAVLVGSRQTGRDRGKNTVEVEADTEKIRQAVTQQLIHGRYQLDSLFGDGNAGKKIAEILASANPPIQKKFHEI